MPKVAHAGNWLWSFYSAAVDPTVDPDIGTDTDIGIGIEIEIYIYIDIE
tara:strand:+ start:207 stop:353 length:147 start_codon:yes stop_codon:yes gene_type:complete